MDATPSEIVAMFTPRRGLQGHEVAMLMSAWWPVIKDALLEYEKSTGGKTFSSQHVPID